MTHKNRNKQLIDLTGQKINRWTVIEYAGFKNSSVQWLCKCECGNMKSISSLSLRTNQSRSCGCYKSEVTSKRNKNKPVHQLAYGEAGINCVFSEYKQSAKKRNFVFEFTREKFKELIFNNCYYCGTEPLKETNKVKYNGYIKYNGIDRIDNSLGYTVSNSVTCCETCNRAKLVMSKEIFLTWVKTIAENLHKKGLITLNLND